MSSSLKFGLLLPQQTQSYLHSCQHYHHRHRVAFGFPQMKTMRQKMIRITSSAAVPVAHPQELQHSVSTEAPFAISSSATYSAQRLEQAIEQAIFNCRFLTFMGVFGSLAGSILCFFKGCTFVAQSFLEYFQTCWHGAGTGKVILLLVEAVGTVFVMHTSWGLSFLGMVLTSLIVVRIQWVVIPACMIYRQLKMFTNASDPVSNIHSSFSGFSDVYLVGTVMLIFGIGLYELFVSSMDVPGGKPLSNRRTIYGSNLFGLFRLQKRPKWLEIHSLDELKTKIGHVVVMILLVGMFDKSKKVPVHSCLDLLCFSASILLSSACLFLLSKLHPTNRDIN